MTTTEEKKFTKYVLYMMNDENFRYNTHMDKQKWQTECIVYGLTPTVNFITTSMYHVNCVKKEIAY